MRRPGVRRLGEAKVAVSPGSRFGDDGDDHVRFAFIENGHRTRQGIRSIRKLFRKRKRETNRVKVAQ